MPRLTMHPDYALLILGHPPKPTDAPSAACSRRKILWEGPYNLTKVPGKSNSCYVDEVVRVWAKKFPQEAAKYRDLKEVERELVREYLIHSPLGTAA